MAAAGSASPGKGSVMWMFFAATGRPPALRRTPEAHSPSAACSAGGGQRAKNSLRAPSVGRGVVVRLELLAVQGGERVVDGIGGFLECLDDELALPAAAVLGELPAR